MKEKRHLLPKELDFYVFGLNGRRNMIRIEGKVPRDKKWQERQFPFKMLRARMENGKGNVGFRLEATHLIIDIDARNDPKGRSPEEILEFLKRGRKIPTRAVVRTGSGGYHIYLKKPAGFKVPKYLPDLGKGIEFKIGPGQQVVAAGSVHPDTSRAYQWTDETRKAFESGIYNTFDGPGEGSLVPDAPKSLLRALERGKKAEKEPGEEGYVPSELDVDEVRDALAYIDNVDRETWRNVGFALHSTGHPEARLLWDEWSQGTAYQGWEMQKRGQRCAVVEYGDYSDEAQERIWNDADADRSGGIRLGTLYKFADRGGWSRNHYRSRQRPSAAEDFKNFERAASSGDLDEYTPSGEIVNDSEFIPEDADSDEMPRELEAYLDFLNQRYALISGNRPQVVEFEEGGLLFHSKEAAFTILREFRACFEVSGKVKKVGNIWEDDPHNRVYKKADFRPDLPVEIGVPWKWDPGRTPILNEWRGWNIQPEKGDFSLYEPYLNHIEEVICCGDPERFNWLMSWLGWFFQNPAKKPQVAVILRGLQGIGKGVFAQGLLRIVGEVHGDQLTNKKGLTGDFNSHLSGTKLVYGDEILWGGNKAEVGKLKTLITEPILTVEPKGRPMRKERSYHGFILASNETWVVPAEADARRFTVLDVSPKYKEDEGYFRRLRKVTSSRRALAAFLWELLHTVKPGNGDPWPNPLQYLRTRGLLGQQIESMDSKEKWLLDVLTDGKLSDILEWPEEADTDPRKWVRKEDVYGSYAEHAGRVGSRRIGMKMEVMKFLREIFGDLSVKRQRTGASGIREHRVNLPPLREARAALNRRYGQDLFKR